MTSRSTSIPAEGGEPRQLTYYPARGPFAPRHGYDNQVMGWTPDGAAILFRSLRDADGVRSEGRLYTVPQKGGLAKALPMPTSGAADFSPDGKRLAYSPLFRDFRTWKRYEGGWAQDLYVYDLATNDAKPFATTKRTERDPMWIGNAVYFASDRDGTLNLYSYDLATEAVTKLTSSTTWDVRWPSSDDASRIVYELDGELHVFDVRTKADQALSIFVPNDGVAKRPSRRLGREERRGLRPQPEGRAGARRGPRRRLHGADREGPHPEPHQHLERPRQVGALVAGRQEDRVPLRPQRRGRGLARRPGRREAGAGDERRPGDALRARSGRRREPTSPSPTRTASSTS